MNWSQQRRNRKLPFARDEQKRHALDQWGERVGAVVSGTAALGNVIELAGVSHAPDA